MKVVTLGFNIQGLIASALMARNGIDVTIVPCDDGAERLPIHATHLPFAIPDYILTALDITVETVQPDNPFEKLPFYDGLKDLLGMFRGLEDSRPDYNEKAWRDTWGTFEIARILAKYDAETQALFAQSTTLSLTGLLDKTDLADADKAAIIHNTIIGSKTDPNREGTAAAILPAMAKFNHQDSRIFYGDLSALCDALKATAEKQGAKCADGQYIQQIATEGDAIRSVQLSGGDILTADYYCLDYDPIMFIRKYLKDYSLPPAFKNRLQPDKNLKNFRYFTASCEGGIDSFGAPDSVAAINNALQDFKDHGMSKQPMISVQPMAGGRLDIIAQYFDPSLADDDTGIAEAVIKAIEASNPSVKGTIKDLRQQPLPTQFGQPSFASALPLLTLFKVFFGHHAIAYDMPVQNMVVCGYGNHSETHHHVQRGGERAANLLQSL